MSKVDAIRTQEQWASEAFWREFCPSMHILDTEFLQAQPLFGVDDQTGHNLKELIATEGYF